MPERIGNNSQRVRTCYHYWAAWGLLIFSPIDFQSLLGDATIHVRAAPHATTAISTRSSCTSLHPLFCMLVRLTAESRATAILCTTASNVSAMNLAMTFG